MAGGGKGDWWNVSRYVPEGRQDMVLLVSIGLAAFLLLLTVIGFSESSDLSGRLAERDGSIARLKAELAERAEAVPPEELAKAEALAREESEARRAAEASARELREAVDVMAARDLESRKELEGSAKEMDGLRLEVEALSETAAGLRAELAAATNRNKAGSVDASRLQLEVERLAKRLTRQLAEGEAALAGLRDRAAGQAADLESEIAKHRSRIEKLLTRLQRREDELSAIVDRIEEVEKELARFPPEPLGDDVAEAEYHDILDHVAEFNDRAERIAILFRAKQTLAGSSYEPRMDGLWRKEQRLKQEDVDRAAEAVYRQALSKTKVHPGSYDENVRILSSALERVRGSKYEPLLRKQIDAQLEKKAAAAAE